MDATPAPTFLKFGRKRFPVPTGYGGRLTSDQETCDDMRKISKTCAREEIMACVSHPLKAKAEASADKTREHAVFVRVVANWL